MLKKNNISKFRMVIEFKLFLSSEELCKIILKGWSQSSPDEM